MRCNWAGILQRKISRHGVSIIWLRQIPRQLHPEQTVLVCSFLTVGRTRITEAWVPNLATELRESGVDIILDKWDLSEGHDDSSAFMDLPPSLRAMCLKPSTR